MHDATDNSAWLVVRATHRSDALRDLARTRQWPSVTGMSDAETARVVTVLDTHQVVIDAAMQRSLPTVALLLAELDGVRRIACIAPRLDATGERAAGNAGVLVFDTVQHFMTWLRSSSAPESPESSLVLRASRPRAQHPR
jgi:hypothetical protein